MKGQIEIWFVGLLTAIIVTCRGEDVCKDPNACPTEPMELCKMIIEKAYPCATYLVSERTREERKSVINHTVKMTSPEQVVAAHGSSTLEAKWLSSLSRAVLVAQQKLLVWCGLKKLNQEDLGIHLSTENGKLQCRPLNRSRSSRKKRQLNDCNYDHNIRCNAESNYRTIDGSCNNLGKPAWGKSFTPLMRFLQANYGDNVQGPRLARDGTDLPSARMISSAMSDESPNLSHVHTFMFVTMGQMIDHDLTETVKTQIEINGTFMDLPCGDDGCSTIGEENAACLPIEIPADDTGLPGRSCLKFVRTETVLSTNCEDTTRQQLNRITSYLDASHVYGNTAHENEELRDTTDSDRGRLIVTQHPANHFRPFLPQGEDPNCRNTNHQIRCFKAGDERVNDQVGLTSLHTLFHRYHNYIEDKLHAFNGHWSGERKYQEARKILIAIWQNIVLAEMVPTIVGPEAVEQYGLGIPKKGYNDVYNSQVNPAISNSFSTAAFRFGHSMLPGNMMMKNNDAEVLNNVSLTEVLRDPNVLYNITESNGTTVSVIDSITMGQIFQQASESDGYFNTQITSHLFTDSPPRGVGMDLVAINIQRGRDHGVQAYNEWRRFCGLEVYTSFSSMRDIPEAARQTFQTIYNHVDDIDLFPAGISETHVAGAAVGPTFACIIAKNFQNVMHGDRFWFERNVNNGFTLDQLNSIKDVTLSSVACAVTDEINRMQKYTALRPLRTALKSLGSSTATDVFALADMYRLGPNIEGRCSQIDQVNLFLWKERNENVPTRQFKATAVDRTVKFDAETGMIIHQNGKEHTEEQYAVEFKHFLTSVVENDEKLIPHFIQTEVLNTKTGVEDVTFDYLLTFSGDLSLSDNQISSVLKKGINNHKDFALNIGPEDIDISRGQGLSTTAMALIISGSLVALGIFILSGICFCCYIQRMAIKQQQPHWKPQQHSYYNHGMDPQLTPIYPQYLPSPMQQTTNSRLGYPRQWKPQRIGASRTGVYESKQSLYGHYRY